MLPNSNITPIPNTQPEATPELWNVRYEEIDENFADVDNRLDDLDGRVGTTDPSYQEALHFEVRRGIEMTALALKELDKTKQLRIQQGEVTINNRGVREGITVTKSSNAARNLNIATGVFFVNGRAFNIDARNNDASVPPNSGSTSKTCVAYLRLNGTTVDFDCSQLGDEAPSDAVSLYRLTVPAGNTESNDAYLTNVTLTDIRRIEANFPVFLDNASTVTVSLPFAYPDSNYQVDLDVVSTVGGDVSRSQLQVSSRANNGFQITLAARADSVKVRYTTTYMGV